MNEENKTCPSQFQAYSIKKNNSSSKHENECFGDNAHNLQKKEVQCNHHNPATCTTVRIISLAMLSNAVHFVLYSFHFFLLFSFHGLMFKPKMVTLKKPRTTTSSFSTKSLAASLSLSSLAGGPVFLFSQFTKSTAWRPAKTTQSVSSLQ